MTHPSTPCLNRRRALVGGLILLAAPAAVAGTVPCRAPRILFVCPAGTVKSAIARETLKRRAAQQGVPVFVTSRGLHPEDHVSPALATNLEADGIDPRSEPLRALAASDLAAADIVIAFDEAAQAPALKGARIWDIPSWNSDYAGAKGALAGQIDGLLSELRRRPCPADPKPAG